jgi:hypothetical protein
VKGLDRDDAIKMLEKHLKIDDIALKLIKRDFSCNQLTITRKYLTTSYEVECTLLLPNGLKVTIEKF